jgi:hypothetical protein
MPSSVIPPVARAVMWMSTASIAAAIPNNRKLKQIINDMSGRIAQNYRKIKSKNYKKNGTRMVAVFWTIFF